MENPYDYIKPIKDEKRFADRKNELKEIEYVLDLTKGGTYFNVAILGERRVGKTSLLNIIAKGAGKRNLLTVMIKLDENNANLLEVFKMIEERIISEGSKYGLFPKWKDYFSQLINGVEKIEIPLLLPKIYFSKKSRGDMDVSYTTLENDMEKFWEKVNKKVDGIVIMVDESQLLARDKALLQRIRNLFETIDGYVLIFSGTPDMLEGLSEVFSPIDRFFVKVYIGPFKNKEDAEEAISKPISNMDIKFDKDSMNRIIEISRRYPYEINLISHFAFRTSQEKGENVIKLDQNVLESVTIQVQKMKEYKGMFDSLAEKEKDFITWFVEVGSSVDRTSLAEHLKEDKEDAREIKEIRNSLTMYFKRLMRKRIIEKDKTEGRRVFYKIKDPWLELYVRYGQKPEV
ncbi:MAG: hypothetical protein A7315_03165 [Candidatus Altiarchaeales archaeon WOR_SM1_79]|nr:MAG: hypothetical protein A7315_03165 [Candidatus Altiarchaeales archaeon WOR_SM1_79]